MACVQGLFQQKFMECTNYSFPTYALSPPLFLATKKTTPTTRMAMIARATRTPTTTPAAIIPTLPGGDNKELNHTVWVRFYNLLVTPAAVGGERKRKLS